jgi:hypothetical protein
VRAGTAAARRVARAAPYATQVVGHVLSPEHATWRIDCRARLHVTAIARHSPQILGAAATTLPCGPSWKIKRTFN